MKEQIYSYILAYIDEMGYSPTIREICKGVGVKSTSTVWKHLWTLRGEGRIQWTDRQSRTLRVL